MPGSAGRGSSAVVRCLVPSDVAASGPGRGDGDAGLDGDLDGVGPDGHRDGLAGVGQADLDSLAADHDGWAGGRSSVTGTIALPSSSRAAIRPDTARAPAPSALPASWPGRGPGSQ